MSLYKVFFCAEKHKKTLYTTNPAQKTDTHSWRLASEHSGEFSC